MTPRLHRRALLVFLAVVAFTQLSFHRALFNRNNGNVWSRIALTFAVVEHGTLAIDPYLAHTQDWSQHAAHRYSNKAPGPALLSVPFYALQRALQGAPADEDAERAAREVAAYVANAVTSIVPTLVALALLFRVGVRRFGLAPLAALGLCGAWATGSLALPYTVVFFGHQSAAAFFAIGMCLTLDGKPTAPRIFWAGLCMGLAVACDYLAGALVLLWTVWLLWETRALASARWKLLAAWALGGLGPALGLAAYHHACFGGIFTTPYARDVINPQFLELNSPGVPSLDRLADITVRPFRGLFYATPLWLLVVLALDGRRARARSVLVAAGAATVAFFAFLSATPAAHGGFCIGPRYAVALLPLALFLLVPAVQLVPRAFALLLALSTAMMLVGCLTEVLPHRALTDPYRDALFPMLIQDVQTPQRSLLVACGLTKVQALCAYLALWAATWAWLWARLRRETAPAAEEIACALEVTGAPV